MKDDLEEIILEFSGRPFYFLEELLIAFLKEFLDECLIEISYSN